MKIGIFTDTYFPQLNGVTISVSNYAKKLREKGHTVYIFAPKIKNYKDHEQFIYRLPSIKILSSEPEVHLPVGVSYKGLVNLLKMEFDVIHAHGNGPFSLLGYEVARAEGIPYIATFHNMFPDYTHYVFNGKILKPAMVARIMRFIANRCDGVIAPSEKMKKKLVEFGCKKEIIVIPNFVELAQFSGAKTGYLHKKLHLSEEIPLLVSVGRLGKEKNFAFLIHMFEKLSQKEKETHLVIVGQGKEKARLQKLVREMGLAKRIHFTGSIPAKDMPQVYADTKLFVFASTSEVHPMVVLEAAAAGVPMVVGNDLAFKNVAINNKNAFVVSLDEKKFVEKVTKLLQDTKLQQQFSQASRQIIQEHFTGEELTEKLISFYEKMYAKHKLQAKILRKMNRVARRGVRGIRKTRIVLDKLIFTS